MTFSNEEELRIQRVEKSISDLNTTVQQLASKRQLNHLLSLMEKELKEIKDELNSLISQLNAIKKQ